MRTRLKLFLGIATVILFTLSANAQVFSGGIVAGASTGAVRIEHSGEGLTEVLQGNNIHSYEAGAFVRLKLGPLYVKPMALYDFSGGNISGNTNSGSTDFSMHRIETPLLFGLKLLKPLSIEAGPVYNYIISYDDRFNDNTFSVSQNRGIGYRAGIAIEIQRLLLNASYSGVTINSNGVNGTTFKEPYKLTFGLGIKIGKLK
jgi:hypothetical protein